MKELIAHTKIFDLVRKDEVMPGFRPVAIEAPDWVTVIAEKDGKFLMTRQVRHGIGAEVEEFVCGSVELNENPLYTAKRELEEETGYVVAVKDFVHLGSVYPNPAFMTNRMHIFYVNLDKAVFAKVDADPGEHEKLTSCWADKYAVIDSTSCERGGVICPAMKLCAVSLYVGKAPYLEKGR